MKITLKDFGPIHRFDFDLNKDLHLIYGENNIGKSWAVNVIYCFLKGLKDGAQDVEINIGRKSEQKKENSINRNLSDYIENLISSNFINNFHGFLENTYTNPTGKIEIKTFEGLLIHEISNKISINLKLSKEEYNFPLKISKYAGTFISLKKNGISNIDFLPASRSGLYAPLSGMGEIMAELSQKNLKSSFKLPRLSQAVSDYFLDLMSEEKSDFDSFHTTSTQVEEKILGGKISLDPATKRIFFTDKAGRKFPVTETASMISELAPLVLILKKIERRNLQENGLKSLLIIEEPEAHLHPKAQVMLMEIFGELIKHNVKIVMTSHSNYMFNKLSNLLLAGEVSAEQTAIYHMEMTEKGSVVRDDMQATAEGAEDHNFADTAADLYEERIELYDRLNAENAD